MPSLAEIPESISHAGDDGLSTRDQIRAAAQRLYFWGGRVQCPCCLGRFRKFGTYHGRAGAICPSCAALERHRAYWLYMENRLDITEKPTRVLYFAPDRSISDRLDSLPNVSYTSADLEPGAAMEQIDMTAIPKPDASFDLALVSHVLEHIPDDGAALRELHRVLAPGGILLTMHPIDPARAETYEDFSITDPAERLKHFHQPDHVRVYGLDFVDRLREPGFAVEVAQPALDLSDADRQRYGVAPDRTGDVYVCAKGVG